jgi:RNA polymerase sigma-70 factor (ECF subfamily)
MVMLEPAGNGTWIEDRVAALYTTAWPRLLRRMNGVLRDEAAAEEVSAEAIFRLTLQIKAGRMPEHPDAWLARVAFNVAMSRGRRQQVAARRAAQLLPLTTRGSVEDEAIDHERLTTMRRAVAELKPDDRLLVLLAASGHSGLEIAGRLGWSHAAVRTRLHRLRARLRVRLDQLEAA